MWSSLSTVHAWGAEDHPGGGEGLGETSSVLGCDSAVLCLGFMIFPSSFALQLSQFCCLCFLSSLLWVTCSALFSVVSLGA